MNILTQERRSGTDRRSGIERRHSVDHRFKLVPLRRSGLARRPKPGWRIIDLRSGEDRRSGRERRRSTF